jgi:hypothetical protein
MTPTFYFDDKGLEHADCHFCGTDCNTHPDAANPLSTCGDCGAVTCLDHRVADQASRCVDCAAAFYASPAPTERTRSNRRIVAAAVAAMKAPKAARAIKPAAVDPARCASCGEYLGDYGCVTVGCEAFDAVTAEKNPAAVALGRRGGQATSAAKTAAARANAKRPRPRDLVLQMSAAGEGGRARLCMEGYANADTAYYFAREAAHYAGLLLAAQRRRGVR